MKLEIIRRDPIEAAEHAGYLAAIPRVASAAELPGQRSHVGVVRRAT